MFIDETDVRQLLDAADPPPTRVDLAEVIRLGQRRRVRQQFGRVAGGAGLALVIAAAVATPFVVHATARRTPIVTATHPTTAVSPASAVKFRTCPVTTLALPAGQTDYDANVVDPSGRYIAGFAASDTIYRSVVWTDGTPRMVSLPGAHGEIDAINSSGTIAGSTFLDGFTDEHVYRIANGTSTILDYPMGGRWHPFDVQIAANGAIAANAEPEHSNDEGVVALLWKPGATTATKLPSKPGSSLDVAGFTAAGDIVGSIRKNNGLNVTPWIFNANGRNGHELSLPTGDGAVIDAVAGQFAGGGTFRQNASGGWGAAVYWDLRTGKRSTADGVSAPITSMTSAGWALGDGNDLNMNGTMAVLPKLKAADDVTARAVADNGLVIGESAHKIPGDDESGYIDTPVVWHC